MMVSSWRTSVERMESSEKMSDVLTKSDPSEGRGMQELMPRERNAAESPRRGSRSRRGSRGSQGMLTPGKQWPKASSLFMRLDMGGWWEGGDFFG